MSDENEQTDVDNFEEVPRSPAEHALVTRWRERAAHYRGSGAALGIAKAEELENILRELEEHQASALTDDDDADASTVDG